MLRTLERFGDTYFPQVATSGRLNSLAKLEGGSVGGAAFLELGQTYLRRVDTTLVDGSVVEEQAPVAYGQN